jgi:23S rRNA pseudouridine2605 synthase
MPAPGRRPREVPLDRALSKIGAASRKEARRLIREGRVSVGGRRVRDPDLPVVPEATLLAVDGHRVRRGPRVVLALHKPAGVLTTRSDPGGRPTVYDLLGDVGARIVPVGRLDLASTGLLLLTSDTRLAAWLTDPAQAIPRRYLVSAEGAISDDAVSRIERGIEIGGVHLAARAVTVRKRSGRETHLLVTLTEGRNREIRRLFAAVGHRVTRLKRVSFGGLALGDLPAGRWRAVTDREMGRAFPGYVDRTAPPRRQAARL